VGRFRRGDEVNPLKSVKTLSPNPRDSDPAAILSPLVAELERLAPLVSPWRGQCCEQVAVSARRAIEAVEVLRQSTAILARAIANEGVHPEATRIALDLSRLRMRLAKLKLVSRIFS